MAIHSLNTISTAGKTKNQGLVRYLPFLKWLVHYRREDLVGDILAGLAPPPGAPQNRLAYKTGTSYGHRDAWAIGYDGRHVIGVWMGRPDGTPVPGAFGAETAAPTLFQAFSRLKRQLDPQPPPPQPAVPSGESVQ